jgi:arylsulfatase A-like enzyme
LTTSASAPPETFGGPLKTPTFDRLAKGGLRYNSFHTTALCSPTRVALKIRAQSHTGNMGFITEMATGLPGATGECRIAWPPWPRSCGSTATAPPRSASGTKPPSGKPACPGPFDRWPTRQGFDKFYGFIGGEAEPVGAVHA